MRVIIVHDFSTEIGGAEKIVALCIRASVEAGFETAALVGDSGESLRSSYPTLKLLALGERALREGLKVPDVFTKVYNRRAFEAMNSLLDWGGDDAVVHVHGWSQILSPSIFYALARHKARVIASAHDFFLGCPNGAFLNFQNGEICRLRPLSTSCLLSKCDKRNYAHKLWRFSRTSFQRRVGDEFWSRLEVLLAHEDMEKYLKSVPVRHFMTLRPPTKPFTDRRVEAWRNKEIVFLGRMTWEKGVQTLVEALASTGKSATLVGRGPLLAETQAALPNCSVPGWLDDDQVADLTRRARIFLMPSRMPEPYGMVAAEAIMCGIPVIVSSNALIANEISKNSAGLVFRSGDPGSLSEQLAKIEDDNLIRKLSDGAFEYSRRIAPNLAEWRQKLLSIYTGEA
jgi:glycosyltransferase involved in cell wall biosynthesis